MEKKMEPIEALTLISGKVSEEILLRNEYLGIENQILKSKIKGRIKYTDEERIRLANAAELIGKKALEGMPTIVTPDTLLKWFRELVTKKFDGSKNKEGSGGHNKIDPEIEKLILKFAKENPSWGYDRITGALLNIGHEVCDQTVKNVLKKHGIPTAPDCDKNTRWADFIKNHEHVLCACDFFTTEVITPVGLITYYILVFIHIGSREIYIAGATPNPNEQCMKQVARNITMDKWGFLKQCNCKYLIHDRDDKFCKSFLQFIKDAGIKTLKLPKRSPNLNAFCERVILSIKSECLSKLIFFGEDSLLNALKEYKKHYHEERNHQGKRNELLFPADDYYQGSNGPVQCRERLGGLLKYYYRDAA